MIKMLKSFRASEWFMLATGVIFIVIGIWFDLEMPEYMKKITGLVQTEGSLMSDIWLNGLYMLSCALGSLICAVVVGFLVAKISASFSKRVRSMLFDKVNSFSMREINKFSTASLITRSTNDVTQVQMFIAMGLQMIIKAPILAIWAVIKISGKGYEWTLANGIAVIILLAMFAIILILILPKFRKMQVLTDNVNRLTRENLTGLSVVRAYNAEDFQNQKFAQANEELTQTHLFTSRGMAFMMPMLNLIMNGLSLAIYWIGAILINNANPQVRLDLFSNMIVFSSYSMQIIMAFMMMTMMFIVLPRASVSAKRINEVLYTNPDIKDGFKEDGEIGRVGEVEFKNVSFKYPGALDYVLDDVSFSIEKGEVIAFIGSTGSGKTTLINLVSRFYEATEGEVLIDGINVRDYKLKSLYNKIGYIPQKAVLFNGTVATNVAFGQRGKETATDEEIKEAIKIAQGTDFVEAMKDSYDGHVSRDGTNLSGGQKQRLSIARAICRKPEIYIFDDSFSALDYKTDRTLRSALKNETKGVTTMIVAQRIGTIIDADKIVVLHEGKIVGIGKHQDLLQNCQVYKEIAISQLSEEELAI